MAVEGVCGLVVGWVWFPISEAMVWVSLCPRRLGYVVMLRWEGAIGGS